MNERKNTIGIISTIVATMVFVVMTLTFICQVGFNKKLEELSEVSATPKLFVVLDSLKPNLRPSHNIYYSMGNAGGMPALAIRATSEITREKSNPFKEVLDTGSVQADIFPNQIEPFPTYDEVFEQFYTHNKPKYPHCETVYFHIRVDYEDMLRRKGWYRGTFWVLVAADSATERTVITWGPEKTECFFPFYQK